MRKKDIKSISNKLIDIIDTTNTMKTKLFTMLTIGFIIFFISLITANIYLLGIAEVLVLIPSIKLIIINLNTPIK